MIEVKIDKEKGTNMTLSLSGRSWDITEEAAVMLIEVCKAIAKGTGNTFDEVFTTVVGAAKVMNFFKEKKEKEKRNEY